MMGGTASPSSRKAMAPIWTAVFHLASWLTGTPTRNSAKNSRRPETRISRARMISAASTWMPLSCPLFTSITSAAATRSLSAMGSRKRPKREIWGWRRAKWPPNQSVTQAAANRPAESHCAQPCSSQKQATTRGIAAMRDSVRMLGRLSMCGLFLPAAPEVVMDFLGERARDARHRLDVLERRHGHGAGTAEMMQQGALAARSDARHFVERRARDVGRATCTVRADGEAMRLVPQALQEIEHRIAWFEREGWLAGHEEAFAAGVSVGPLGDADGGDVFQAELGQHLARHLELALAAVDQHQVGPMLLGPFGIFLQRAAETARRPPAHHGEIVPRRALGLDVELAIGILDEAVWPRHHHGADRRAALDMA